MTSNNTPRPAHKDGSSANKLEKPQVYYKKLRREIDVARIYIIHVPILALRRCATFVKCPFELQVPSSERCPRESAAYSNLNNVRMLRCEMLNDPQ